MDATTIDRMLAYLDLLVRWNTTYNLTAVRDPDDMLTQHLVDCLAVLSPMQRMLGEARRRVLDVGSGGGLPGVVLAMLRPDDAVVCVDAVGKKAAFVRQVGLELRLPNLQVEHARVERLDMPGFNVIVSRAFATLRDFTVMTKHLVAPGGTWMAMKGKRPDKEMAEMPADVAVFHVEQLAVPGLSAERCVVWMRAR